jgi:hypothetical protein
MRRESGIYKVLMNQRWALEDLYTFPHTYSQIYSFIYCFDSELDAYDAERINFSIESYPWRGGYSYLNIYKVLFNQIPYEHRPEIARIQYASPGFMDILLNPDVALKLAESVGILLGIGVAATETYKRIHKNFLEMRAEKKKHDAELITYSATELKSMIEMSETLARQIGFENVAKLDQRTKNPEITLKLLMAHYRRLDILGNFVREGKVALPEQIQEKGNS